MKPNRLREKLNAGEPTIGTHLICAWPGLVEIIGHSGVFDYVEFVAEYSPFSFDQLENWGRTIELFPQMSSMIKLEELLRQWAAPRAEAARQVAAWQVAALPPAGTEGETVQ